MPTSQGSQYFGIRSLPSMSHGWTKMAAPSCSAALQTGWSDALSRFNVSMRPECGFASTCVPICAPRKPKSRTHRSSSLRRQIRILQWNRGQAGESRRMSADNFGDVIVQAARKIERVGRLRPVAEHHRHGRKHLHGNAGAVHSSMRRFGSQALSVISRKTRSPIIIRAQQGL